MKRKQSLVVFIVAGLLASIVCLQITVYAGLFEDVFACGDAYSAGMSNCSVDCTWQPTEEERSACRSARAACYSQAVSDYGDCLSPLGWEDPQMDKCGAADYARDLCNIEYQNCGGFTVEGCLSSYNTCLMDTGIYQCE